MMETTSLTLTVFFDDPFWVGVFERADGGRLSVCRVVFGAEPRDAEVLALVLRQWQRLSFSEAVPAAVKPRCRNPKRRQRAARKAAAAQGVGTKAQQALARQREAGKAARRAAASAAREEQAAARHAAKCAKRKEKHRGH